MQTLNRISKLALVIAFLSGCTSLDDLKKKKESNDQSLQYGFCVVYSVEYEG